MFQFQKDLCLVWNGVQGKSVLSGSGMCGPNGTRSRKRPVEYIWILCSDCQLLKQARQIVLHVGCLGNCPNRNLMAFSSSVTCSCLFKNNLDYQNFILFINFWIWPIFFFWTLQKLALFRVFKGSVVCWVIKLISPCKPDYVTFKMREFLERDWLTFSVSVTSLLKVEATTSGPLSSIVVCCVASITNRNTRTALTEVG